MLPQTFPGLLREVLYYRRVGPKMEILVTTWDFQTSIPKQGREGFICLT